MALHRELSANVVGFCRLLRQGGVGAGPAEQGDALRALEWIALGDGEAFRLALRTTLAKSAEEQEVFDQHFDSYWRVWDRAGELNRRSQERSARTPTPRADGRSSSGRPSFLSIKDWLKGQEATEEEEAAGYSPFEVITRRDFSGFSAAEAREIAHLIARIARALATRFSRRYQQTQQRGKVDLRRTLRLNLRRGGDLFDLAFRRRRFQKLKLVLLCDVSKSMDLYSLFLIQFIHAFQSVYRRIETFVFSTSLHRLTPTLKAKDLAAVLAGLSKEVPDWSGGTKIGVSLQTFLSHYAATLVDRNTVVLIMSDGWDTGDLEVLESSMGELQRRAHCLIWLNPLLGNPDYRPSCRGMQVALPFIDLFAPAHNLDSLKDLVRQLARIQGRRPWRRGQFRKNPAWERTAARQAPEAPLPAPLPAAALTPQDWLKRFGRLPG
ncbi:MAG: VWA domain-containing protein [Candidatus Latescibacteria bacterium]|nr:VWA domain-containing protein [Candidatus Latescibacterota bacterium]